MSALYFSGVNMGIVLSNLQSLDPAEDGAEGGLNVGGRHGADDRLIEEKLRQILNTEKGHHACSFKYPSLPSLSNLRAHYNNCEHS